MRKKAEIQDLRRKRDGIDVKARYVYFYSYNVKYLLTTSIYIAKITIKTSNRISPGDLDVIQSTIKEIAAVIKSIIPRTIKSFSRIV
jgi:hypothetical protein